MEFFTKSKTFLIGEYSVLFGGKAIVLTTFPEFSLKIEKSENSFINGISEHSPAFLFYLKHIDIFQNISINFFDPHNGGGGFGASSAQFALLYKLYLQLINKKFRIDDFLETYKIMASTEGKVYPSGADCLAQFHNQHIYFDATTNYLTGIQWSFSDISFSIFKTNIKVPTHFHISQLNIEDKLKIKNLEKFTETAKFAISSKNHKLLYYSIQTFYELLCGFGLVIDDTQKIVRRLLDYDFILAAKGCGALGADTIIIIHDKKKLYEVSKIAISLNLKPTINILD